MKNRMIVQLYSDGDMRGFVGNNMVFESKDTDWRKLDALGLPRLGKKGHPWEQTDWGWEIKVDFKTVVAKN